jgi:hypothetical protein
MIVIEQSLGALLDSLMIIFLSHALIVTIPLKHAENQATIFKQQQLVMLVTVLVVGVQQNLYTIIL